MAHPKTGMDIVLLARLHGGAKAVILIEGRCSRTGARIGRATARTARQSGGGEPWV